MKNEIFELVSVTDNMIVVKVNGAEDPFVAALHPYLPEHCCYITVTRGEEYTLTITKSDASKYSYHWGRWSSDRVSDNVHMLSGKVCGFIHDCGILREIVGGRTNVSGHICYNDWRRRWQLGISRDHEDPIFMPKEINNLESAIKWSKKFISFDGVSHRIAVTGIDVWDLINAKMKEERV